MVTDKHRLPLLLALIASGLAGNYYSFPIFLNIDFLFGSIFAMLALQLIGFGQGIVAAAVIASYTYFLWNHPYTIFVMTAEVAVVGWLMERRNLGMVLADTLYWLIIGMPLGYLLYHLAMHLSLSNTAVATIKQAINGIANCLAARLIFTGIMLWSRTLQPSLKDIVYNLMAFFVLCPALIMLAVSSRTDFNEIDHSIRKELIQDSRSLSDRLESWVGNRKSAILNLAEMAASRTSLEMQPYLEVIRKSDTNFLRVGLLDKTATTTAYAPLVDDQGKSNLGISAADRPYVSVLRQTLKPMLSEMLMGRIGVPRPRVFLLAPVVVRGEYNGYVVGVLSLEQLQEHLDKSTNYKATLYTLLDKNNNVIMSNRSDQAIMAPFVRREGTLNHLDTEMSQWVPAVPPNTPFIERWKQSSYVAESAIGNLAEWKLILEQPVAPYQKRLYDSYAGKLSLLFLILLGALALAELFSRRSIATIEELCVITHGLPNRIGTEGKEIAWPESGIKESNNLIHNCRIMADSLSTQFTNIRQINESLEQMVEERTANLRQSQAFHLAILNSINAEIAVLDSDGVIIAVNESWLRFAADYGIEATKPVPHLEVGANYFSSCQPCIGSAADGALNSIDGIQSVMDGRSTSFSLEYPCHSLGQERWFRMNVTPLDPDRRQGVVVVHTNITERKQAEEALQQAHDELERRVQQRTTELLTINEILRQEVEERQQAVERMFKAKSTVTMAIDGISEPLILLNADNRVKRLNKAAKNYYKLASYQEAIGKFCFEAFWGRSTPCEGCDSPFSDIRGYSGSFERKGRVNSDRLEQVVVDVVKDESGTTRASIVRIFDITQARMMDRRLIQSEKLASLGLLIAGIAHEINNPNNFIFFNTPILRSYLQFLLPIVDEYVVEHPDLHAFNMPYAVFREDCFKLLNNVEHGSIRINQIVGNLREFVRERGQGERRRIDLKQVVEKGISICLGRIRKTVKTFETDIPEGLPPLFTDPLAIEQIVVNLLVNAIQAANKKDSWVELKILWSQAEDEIILEVGDNGCGMDSKTQRSIFDPFFTTKATGVGTGLGLSICHRLVTELGGRIEVQSEVDKGSAFRVIFKTNTTVTQ